MRYCANCGAELGVGRFCTNCGARIDATPPPPPPPAPPPSPAPPPPAVAAQPPRAAAALPPPPVLAPSPHRQRSAVSPVWITVLVLALIGSAALGTWLATRGSDDEESGANATGSPSATSSDPTSPTLPTQGAGQDDLAPTATVTGPRPIPPGLDLNNNPVSYPASNMLDDDPESAYRLPGDAAGAVITFELTGVKTISQVGLINGYTKVDTSGGSTVDWYPANRRILRVEWAFDDGTTVEQPLDPEVRELQLIEVDDIETSTVQLTILEVTAPGARDVTAISDVLLLGS